MSTMLLSLVEHEGIQAPVNMSALRRTSTSQRAWSLFAIVTSLVGSLAVASAVGAVWQAGQATRALPTLPAEDVWTDAWITRLDSQSLGLVMEDGRKWELGLDFNKTSVFQKGGVLNVTHLRVGQWVQVLSGRDNGTMMAKAIEIRPLNAMLAVN